MNTNLLAIVKRIITEQGEAILDNPQRLKAFFMDYAKDEPKKERLAFGRCVEMGCYAELKGCGNVEERQYKKSKLADALHKNTGIDRPYCADALDLLEVVIFGEQEKNLCKNCGKEMQVGWKSCPFCVVATADAASATAGNQRKGKTQYYLSYNYKETRPYNRDTIRKKAANGQITADYFARADNSTEWKPVTTLCSFPTNGVPHSVGSPVVQDVTAKGSSPPFPAEERPKSSRTTAEIQSVSETLVMEAGCTVLGLPTNYHEGKYQLTTKNLIFLPGAFSLGLFKRVDVPLSTIVDIRKKKYNLIFPSIVLTTIDGNSFEAAGFSEIHKLYNKICVLKGWRENDNQ